jgi:hypothetical protein
MKAIGGILGVISFLIMLIGIIPLLGWVNWINFPIAAVGLVCSIAGDSSGGKTLCIVAIIVGALRLMLLGGIF